MCGVDVALCADSACGGQAGSCAVQLLLGLFALFFPSTMSDSTPSTPESTTPSPGSTSPSTVPPSPELKDLRLEDISDDARSAAAALKAEAATAFKGARRAAAPCAAG
jgi:hypothetical protein